MAHWNAVFKNLNCMKAQKRFKRLPFFIVAGAFLCFTNKMASQSFSAHKNLHELQKALDEKNCSGGTSLLPPNDSIQWQPYDINSSALPDRPPSLSRVFLPKWSAECLPFFCRIEHKFAKTSAVPVKFRLGSVEYVDWLEGKTRFPTFAPQ